MVDRRQRGGWSDSSTLTPSRGGQVLTAAKKSHLKATYKCPLRGARTWRLSGEIQPWSNVTRTAAWPHAFRTALILRATCNTTRVIFPTSLPDYFKILLLYLNLEETIQTSSRLFASWRREVRWFVLWRSLPLFAWGRGRGTNPRRVNCRFDTGSRWTLGLPRTAAFYSDWICVHLNNHPEKLGKALLIFVIALFGK